MGKRFELAGRVFGKWTVESFHHKEKRRLLWTCRCECGTVREVLGSNLLNGGSICCGCVPGEKVSYFRKGNVPANKSKDARMQCAKNIWGAHYKNGCSFEKFYELSQQNCFYCGIEPCRTANRIGKECSEEWRSQGNFTYNGLDRVDSNKNHSEDNVVACCYDCNVAKLDHSLEEFKKWIDRCYHHLHQTENNQSWSSTL